MITCELSDCDCFWALLMTIDYIVCAYTLIWWRRDIEDIDDFINIMVFMMMLMRLSRERDSVHILYSFIFLEHSIMLKY